MSSSLYISYCLKVFVLDNKNYIEFSFKIGKVQKFHIDFFRKNRIYFLIVSNILIDIFRYKELIN